MEQLKIKVYAKLNLMLDIKGVLEDGYHSLDMIMESCSLYDELVCEKSVENSVYMDGVLQDEKNTAYRALEVLTLAYGYKMKVEIKKHIPMCAGVGGSSADAAGDSAYCGKGWNIRNRRECRPARQSGYRRPRSPPEPCSAG